MGKVSEYAFLHARVSLFAARLLPGESLRELLEQPGVAHGDYFVRTGIPALVEAPPDDAHELEQQLATVLLGETFALARVLSSPARHLLLHWMHRFDMVNLKMLIRCKLSGCGVDEIRRRLLILDPVPGLPLDSLMHTESIEELLREMEAGPCAELAKQLRRSLGGGEGAEVFLVEAAVDYFFFKVLNRKVAALSETERRDLRPFIGRIIDQANLVWLMRYRLAYGMTPPQAYFMLVSRGLQLDRGHLAALARLEGLRDMIEALPPNLALFLRDADTISGVEDRFNAYLLEEAQRTLKYTRFNLARAIAYLLLRERQLLNIHQVLKGRLLGLPDTLIRRAIGLSDEREAA
ncbi:MAG: V-type ATPase subunit [Pseudomonadota bacterium]